MKITVLLKGVHAMRDHEKGVHIYDHTSSVTLIQHEGRNILVDTGSRGHFELIRENLAGIGLTPASIDTVILTHFHLDHVYNVAHFSEARVIGWKHEWGHRSTLRFHDLESEVVMDGVFLLHTPGHTPEHLAVGVRMPDGPIVMMAGDAINADYANTGKIHAYAYDPELYKKSADRILQIAHRIIPGHGDEILVKK